MLNMEPNTGLDLTTLRSLSELKSNVGHSTDCTMWVPQVIIPNNLYSVVQIYHDFS